MLHQQKMFDEAAGGGGGIGWGQVDHQMEASLSNPLTSTSEESTNSSSRAAIECSTSKAEVSEGAFFSPATTKLTAETLIADDDVIDEANIITKLQNKLKRQRSSVLAPLTPPTPSDQQQQQQQKLHEEDCLGTTTTAQLDNNRNIPSTSLSSVPSRLVGRTPTTHRASWRRSQPPPSLHVLDDQYYHDHGDTVDEDDDDLHESRTVVRDNSASKMATNPNDNKDYGGLYWSLSMASKDNNKSDNNQNNNLLANSVPEDDDEADTRVVEDLTHDHYLLDTAPGDELESGVGHKQKQTLKEEQEPEGTPQRIRKGNRDRLWGCALAIGAMIGLIVLPMIFYFYTRENKETYHKSPPTDHCNTSIPSLPPAPSSSSSLPPTVLSGPSVITLAPSISPTTKGISSEATGTTSIPIKTQSPSIATTSSSTMAPTLPISIMPSSIPSTSPSALEVSSSPPTSQATTSVPTSTTTTTTTDSPTTTSQMDISRPFRLTTLPPLNANNGGIVSLPDFTMEAIENDRTSPQAKAYNWFSDHPFSNEWDEWKKQQVFAMATIYYAFHDDDNDGSGGGQKKRQRLRWLSQIRKESLNYFVSDCFWSGVESACTDTGDGKDRITHLRITEGTNPHGTIPPEVILLPALERISFTGNDLSDVTLEDLLPQQLESLPNLARLHILWNRGIVGSPIPSILWSLESLTDYWLESNDEVDGQIPTQLGLMAKLERLAIIDNPALGGNIPSEMSFLSNLQVVELYGNSLLGVLPMQICKLPDLAKIVIDCDFVLCSCAACQCHETNQKEP